MNSNEVSAIEEEYVITIQYPYRYFEASNMNPLLYISIIILITIPLNIIVRKFRIPAGDRVIMLIIGCLYIYFSHLKFFLDINIFNFSIPIHKLTWLLPLLQFRNLFLLELYIMKKARYEIFIMSIVCNFLVVLGTTVSLAILILEDTSILSCILFATIITCVEGCDSFKRVKEMERNKHLLIILESESLLGYTLFLTSFHVVMRTYEGLLDTWQSQVLFTLQYVGGGILCGIVLGRISGWLLSLVYNDAHNALVVCLCCNYIFYAVSEYVLLVSGPVVTCIVSLNLSNSRKKLTAEAVLFIRNFIEILVYATNVTVFVVTSSKLIYSTIYFYPGDIWVHVAFSYCFVIVLRMASLLVAYPILCRIGYCMDLSSCTFYGWAGASRGPVSLVLAEIAYRNKYSAKSFKAAMPHVLATIILSILINYSTYSFLLKKLGFFTMSTMRKGNMQNCIDYLNGRKWTLLTILKMASRLMTDTNYPVVYKYTVIKNPYRSGGNAEEDEDEEKLINELGLRESKCPWCSRDISLQPTAKEKKENVLEAKLRLLKTQKAAFIRQYELGMLSKDAVRFILHLVEAAMASNDLVVKLDDFFKIFSVKDFYYYTKKIAELMYGMETIKMPKQKCRRICYKIVTHFGFECCMFALIIIVTIPFVIRYFVTYIHDRSKGWTAISSSIVLVIFLSEIMVKIYSFSSDGYYDGLRTYFRSKWNILDFSVVSVHMVVICIGVSSGWYLPGNEFSTLRTVIMNFNDGFKLLRLFRILRFVSASFIAKCNQKISSRISFGYDVGKVIVVTYNDLNESLYQITENPDIMSNIKNQLDKDRDLVNITLEDVIKLKPSVLVQVKTKQAIRSTLNHMRVVARELKNLGYVDNLEFELIMGRLYERNTAVKTLNKIKCSAPKTIFMELSFMISEDSISEILFSQAEVVNWDTNTIIANDLSNALGIYILLQGILRITYIPHQRVVDDLVNFGILPIVDFVSPFRADMVVEEFIFPGNSFGEIAVLTQRHYNCRIQADTKSRAIFLSIDKMQEAMRISCDPVQGLATRLWKYVVMEFATAILRTSPGYQNSSIDHIRLTIDRSFIPNLQHYRTFVVTDLMEDLLLLEGIVADAATGDVYVAPCYLPRTVQNLILYNDPTIDMEVKVIPKLLVIPMKDVDEYEIMERVEDMAELIENPPNYLLVHKYRKMKIKKSKKGAGGGGGGLIGLGKKRRVMESSTMQVRSRILTQSAAMKSEQSISVKGRGESESDYASHESGSSATSSRVTYQTSQEYSHSEGYMEEKVIETETKGNFITPPSIDKSVEEKSTEDSIVKETIENYLLELIENVCSKIEGSTLQAEYSWKLGESDKLVSEHIELDENVHTDILSKVHEIDHALQAKDEKIQIGLTPPIQPNAKEEAKNTEVLVIEVIEESVSTDSMIQSRQALDETLTSTEHYIQYIINDLVKNKVVPKIITNIELYKSKYKPKVPHIKVEEFSQLLPDYIFEEAITGSPLPIKEDNSILARPESIKVLSHTIQGVEANKKEIISVEEPIDIPKSGTKSITLEDNHESMILDQFRGIEDKSDVKHVEEIEEKQITQVVYPDILEAEAKFVADLEDQQVKDKQISKDSYIPKDVTKYVRNVRRLNKEFGKKTKPKHDVKVKEHFQCGHICGVKKVISSNRYEDNSKLPVIKNNYDKKSIKQTIESVEKVIPSNLDKDTSKLAVIKDDDYDKLQTDDRVIAISKSVSGAFVKKQEVHSDQIHVQQSKQAVRRSSKGSQEKAIDASEIQDIKEKYIIQPDHIPIKLKKASIEIEHKIRSSKESQDIVVLTPIKSLEFAMQHENDEAISSVVEETQHANTKGSELLIEIDDQVETTMQGLYRSSDEVNISEEQQIIESVAARKSSDILKLISIPFSTESIYIDSMTQPTNQTNDTEIEDAMEINEELLPDTSRTEKIQFQSTEGFSKSSYIDKELMNIYRNNSPQRFEAIDNSELIISKTSVERDLEIKNDTARERPELKTEDKKKKRKDKVVTKENKHAQNSEEYEIMANYDIFSKLSLNASRAKLLSNHKEHNKEIHLNRTSADAAAKPLDSDQKLESKLLNTIRERRASLPIPSIVPVHEDRIAKPELISDDKARELYLELTRKRLEKKIKKMKAEKDQKGMPKHETSVIGLELNIDLDLERKSKIWKLSDNKNEYYSDQRGIGSPALIEEGKRKKTKGKSKDISKKEEAKGSEFNYDIPSTAIETGKYDRSVEEVITEQKKKTKHQDSIEDHSRSDNEEKYKTSIVEERNAREIFKIDTGLINISNIPEAKEESFLNINKPNIKIVDDDKDGERSGKKGNKIKYSNEIDHGSTPSTKEIHFKSFDEDQNKSEIKPKRRASIAVPEANIKTIEPDKEQQFHYKKDFRISTGSWKLDAGIPPLSVQPLKLESDEEKINRNRTSQSTKERNTPETEPDRSLKRLSTSKKRKYTLPKSTRKPK